MRRRAALVGVALLFTGPANEARAQAPVDSAAAPRPALPPDRWLGADKPKHFFLAGFTTAAAFAGARTTGLQRRPALATAGGVAALVSVGKEIRDRRVTGRFSARDLAADALGVLAYGALLVRTTR